MKLLKSFIIAIAALAVTGPAFAGRDHAQIIEHDRAVQKLVNARGGNGMAGPTGPQGQVGPATLRASGTGNVGHPSERVRR